ncbi:LUD domain-containing protein [Halegenticoccus tardaugens]|uniref:LUD domain-containing protein n=1 Tax=Halegenticoccus tardaugens TaxID=2071624 RepID=UPI00100C2A61|nr:LUD domain-containing protein [Halegenticoccus tardaugens]
MPVQPETKFEVSLRRHGTSWTRTTSDAFAAAVTEAIETPAVATDLSDWELDFEDAPVTVDPTPRELLEATTGVTGASLGVSSYGSLLLPSDAKGTEPVSLYPERHVAVVRESDVVADVSAAFDRLGDEFAEEEPTSTVFATGPSATGDMGALVYGVHGPKSVHVIILIDR